MFKCIASCDCFGVSYEHRYIYTHLICITGCSPNYNHLHSCVWEVVSQTAEPYIFSQVRVKLCMVKICLPTSPSLFLLFVFFLTGKIMHFIDLFTVHKLYTRHMVFRFACKMLRIAVENFCGNIPLNKQVPYSSLA